MEDGDETNGQEQHTASRNNSARVRRSSTSAMDVSFYNRSFEPMTTRTEDAYRRVASDRHLLPFSPVRGYLEHSLSSNHLVSSDVLQGAHSAFSVADDGGRTLQYSLPSDYGCSQYHYVSPPLPPVQHSSPFDTASQYLPRPPGFFGSTCGSYSTSMYLPSIDHNTSCVGTSANLFASAGPSDQDYLGIATSHSGSIGSIDQPEHDGQSAPYPSSSVQSSQTQAVPPYPPLAQLNPHQAAPTEQTQQDELQAGFEHFEGWLRTAFDAISAGRLPEASNYLLLLSNWLVASIVTLDLQHDKVSEYDRRLHLWRDFNHCWEALAQRQKNTIITQREDEHHDAEPLTVERINEIVGELLALCDKAEKFGLVDYEMGIWEEQIVDAFASCLDLMQQQQQEEQ